MKQIEEEEKDRKVTLYVLNNFIKFERKLYQFAGLPFGRPVKIKTIGYFGGILLLGIAIYFTPGIKHLIRWIPPGLLILIPITVAWLLSDLGTEGRSPIKFFGSFFKYQYRKLNGSLHYRNKKIPKFRTYTFNNFVSHSNFDFATNGIDINELEVNDKATKTITMSKGNDELENNSQVNDDTDIRETANETVKIEEEIKEELNIENNEENEENVIDDVETEQIIDEKDDIFGYLFQAKEDDSESDSDYSNNEIIDFLTEEVSDDDTTENITIEEKSEQNDKQAQQLNGLSELGENIEMLASTNEQKNESAKQKKSNDVGSKIEKVKNKLRAIDFSKIINNKKMLLISASALVFVVVFTFGLLFAINQGNTSGESNNDVSTAENSNDALNLGEEDHLLAGIKASSRQNYEEATEHFDSVDFSSLEKDDKEIVLLSYLYTDQVEKILELEPKFDEVVVSYYQAKENLSKIRQLQDLSDEFKFAIAVEDDDYNEIIELRKKVNLDEDKEVAIIKAYVELDEIEDALSFAKEVDNTRYIKQLESLVGDKGKNKKKENDDD